MPYKSYFMKNVFVFYMLLSVFVPCVYADDSHIEKEVQCKQPKNVTERTMCADENLVQTMERLSSVLHYHMTKFNEEGSKALAESQEKWRPTLYECKADKECIESTMNKRINAIESFKDPNSSNPHYFKESKISLRNHDDTCLQDKICNVTLIGYFGSETSLFKGVLYFEDLGMAVHGVDEITKTKLSKSEVFVRDDLHTRVDKNDTEDTEDTEGVEETFRSPSAGAVTNISYFDNDFIRFDMEGEGCGANCNSWHEIAYLDIANMSLVDTDSTNLMAKLINEIFCKEIAQNNPSKKVSQDNDSVIPTDKYSEYKKDTYNRNDSPQRCYKSLAKAKAYFYSKSFSDAWRTMKKSDLLWLESNEYYPSLWWDTAKHRIVDVASIPDILTDTKALRDIFVDKFSEAYCPSAADDVDDIEAMEENYPICKDKYAFAQCLFLKDSKESCEGEIMHSYSGASFGGDSIIMSFEFPRVWRALNDTIMIPYIQLKPFAKGILKEMIEQQGI